jgi:hypothetical protein
MVTYLFDGRAPARRCPHRCFCCDCRWGDRDSLDLPGAQLQLLEAVVRTGTPVVLVTVTGRTPSFGGPANSILANVTGVCPFPRPSPPQAQLRAKRTAPTCDRRRAGDITCVGVGSDVLCVPPRTAGGRRDLQPALWQGKPVREARAVVGEERRYDSLMMRCG